MNKASEYREHAAKCKALAAGSQSSEHRDMLAKMAQGWESLAEEMERYSERHPEKQKPQE